jgi:hypothetical protein
MPVASGWPTKKGKYFVMINFLYLNLTADGAIERPKQVSAPEVAAHRLLKGDVVGDHIT